MGVVEVQVVRALVALLLVAGAAPATAGGHAGCGEPRAVEPRGSARSSGPPLHVTDAHTATRPLQVDYVHRRGVTAYHQAYVREDAVLTVVQLRPRARRTHLWVRAEFSPTPTDVDLYLYDHLGRMQAWSESSNNAAEDAVYGPVFGPHGGGDGFESITAHPVGRCATMTVETINSKVLQDTPVRVTFWLAPPPRG